MNPVPSNNAPLYAAIVDVIAILALTALTILGFLDPGIVAALATATLSGHLARGNRQPPSNGPGSSSTPQLGRPGSNPSSLRTLRETVKATGVGQLASALRIKVARRLPPGLLRFAAALLLLLAVSTAPWPHVLHAACNGMHLLSGDPVCSEP